MKHGIVLQLTTSHIEKGRDGKSITKTDSVSLPFSCQCGLRWHRAGTLVAHIVEEREKEAA